MSDFYSAWLERSQANDKKVNDAPRVARGKELKWVRTRQDYKAALMIAPELGFPTGGSCLMRAEIPGAGTPANTFTAKKPSTWRAARASWFWTTNATTFSPARFFTFPTAHPISCSTRA